MLPLLFSPFPLSIQYATVTQIIDKYLGKEIRNIRVMTDQLVHLQTAWDVDRRIVLDSAEKVVLVRFSRFETQPSLPEGTSADDLASFQALFDYNMNRCAQMDVALHITAQKVRNFCVVYAVDIEQVPEFNTMYDLGGDDEPFAIMFFFRGKHITVDVGTGNNNKINFLMDEADLIAIIEKVFQAGKRGNHSCSSDKKFAHEAIRR